MSDVDADPAAPAAAGPPSLSVTSTATMIGVVAVLVSAAVAVGANVGGWPATGGVAVGVVCLAVGWGDLLHLPQRGGSGLLVALFGAGALLVVTGQEGSDRPLYWFPSLLAAAVLAAFGHELFRRDGRGDLVESVAGTLTGQVVAVLAAGWLLLVRTVPGWDAVLVATAAASVALVASRLLGFLPGLLPSPILPWAAVGCGLVAAVVAAVLAPGVPLLTAVAVGASVAAVCVVLDRLLVRPGAQAGLLAVLAAPAAAVAAAGTVAYTVVRISQG